MASDVNSEGGAKKFLYSGPAKPRGPAAASQFDNDVDEREWNFDAQINTATNKLQHNQRTASPDFDIDSVWSVKKNVNIPNLPTSNRTTAISQGPTSNAGKGYYSRHTGVSEGTSGPGGNSQNTGTSAEYAGKTWNQSSNRTFSYSNPNGEGDTRRQTSQASNEFDTPTARQPNQGAAFRTGGISQGGRVGNQSNSKYNSRPY